MTTSYLPFCVESEGDVLAETVVSSESVVVLLTVVASVVVNFGGKSVDGGAVVVTVENDFNQSDWGFQRNMQIL